MWKPTIGGMQFCYTLNQSQPSSILFPSHISICSSLSSFIFTFISCVLFFTQNIFSHISELDFDFIKWLRAQVKGMRTKQIWQPALRKLFSFPAPDDRQEALKFLLQSMKKFQVVLLLRFCPGLHSLFTHSYTLSDRPRNRSGMWDQMPALHPLLLPHPGPYRE